MRSFALVSLLVLVVGCASHRPEQPYVYTPPVVIAFKSLQHAHGGFFAVFTMSNVGTEPMWYDGDDRERPPYCIEYKGIKYWEHSKNVSDMAGRYELAPGQSVDFRLWRREFSGPFRVGVWLGLEKDQKTMNDDIWWSGYVNPSAALNPVPESK